MNRTEKEKKIGEWIDGEVIAELLMEGLETANSPLTIKNAKDLWLIILEKLGSFIDETALSRN